MSYRILVVDDSKLARMAVAKSLGALQPDWIRLEAANAGEAAHRAALLSAKAKIVADEFAIRGGSLLFDVGGASATKKITNFDRHWRNARTLSSHNPSTYKARSIGQYEISGTPLPAKGFF